MKKKLLFSAYTLDVGGIETALISLLDSLDYSKYEVTLVLEKRQGIFLDNLNKNVTLIEYAPNNSKNWIIRKFNNLIKRVEFILKYKNRFDFSASFATYSRAGSFVALTASKNPVLWVHTDYSSLYNYAKMKEFFTKIKFNKFRKMIFVSNVSKENFIKVFPEKKDICLVCNNIIDPEKILQQSNEEIEMKRTDVKTFLILGRQTEEEKKLSRVIEVGAMLKQENYNFRMLFIGDGRDTERYKNIIKEKELEDKIMFLGVKKNPFPYFKISDAVLLTSDYEGFPVIYTEAMVLNVPIITTDVSDAKELIDGKYGMVTDKSIEDIFLKIKQFMNYGFKIKGSFNPEEYNNNIAKQLQKLFLKEDF